MIDELNTQFERKLLRFLKSETLLDVAIKDVINSYTKCLKQETFYDKILIYFETCMKKDYNLVNYMEAIQPLMVADNFDFLTLVGEIQSYDINDLVLRHDITRNKDQTLKITLQPVPIEKATSLPTDDILKEILQYLGFSNEKIFIKKLQKSEMEWKLLSENYANKNKLRRIATFKLRDLTVKYPRLKLQNYLQHLMGTQVNRVSSIKLRNPQYFQYLNDKVWSDEELAEIKLYLSLKFVIALQVEKSEEDCIKELWNFFHLGLNFIYYLRYFRWEAAEFQASINDLFFKIKTIMFSLFIENNLRLSDQQIQHLGYKLKDLKLNIGNIFPIENVQAIQSYYEQLPPLNKTNYYRNHLNLLKHKFYQSLIYDPQKSLNNSHFDPSTPFYESELNAIVLPFGSLQLPLFHYRQSPLEKLSLFGFVLAHELTHAFDNKVLASEHNPVICSITNHTNFKTSLKCLHQQHATDFLNERVADLVALRVAYITYKTYYAKNALKWQKKFFMNMGTFFCGNSSATYISHDSDPIRLRQLVSNSEHFAEAFNCREGDAMHPPKKCRLY
ncbi:neprilysin-2-like isoform 2-T5 [Cochliomyia hominivorax]